MTYTSREVYEYISLQTNDPIVSWKTCRISGTQFPIYTSDMAFYAKISPTFAGQKFQIPTPTLCPEERQRRRQSFKNEKRLYKRRCDATGEQIISIYSPDKSYKVYTNKYRRSDARNPMDYEQDFDFTKTFTDNFTNLSNRVPKDQLTKEFLEQENCDYTNAAGPSKNCYMVFEMGFNENCMYGSNINYSTNVVDGFFMNHTQNSYQCINCNNCNTIQYCFGCEDCSDCFLCTNLINKKYYIYNKQYTEGEYRQQIQKIQKDNPQGLQQIFETFLKQQDIYITTKQKSNEQTHGNYINNSHNTHIAYDCDDTRDCKHIYGTWGKV